MEKGKIMSTIRGIPAYVRGHWNKPNEGEYLSLKEITAYTASQAGSYVFMTASGIMTFTASYFCGAIMEIAAMDFYIINLIGTILGYVLMFLNPVGVLIYENHGQLTKKTKIFAHCGYMGQILLGIACYFIPAQSFEFIMKGFPQILGNSLLLGGITNYITWFIRKNFCAKHGRLKPFILAFGFPSAIIMSILPFLPLQEASYTTRLIVLHFGFTLMNYFYNGCINISGMVTFMTPNSQERQRLYSIVPIITGLIPSIINMFFPILIGTTGGYLSLKTYKIFVPIFSIIGAFIMLFIAKCKERIIEPPMEQRKKVKFWAGAKNVLKNKYFWITNISNLFTQWQYIVTGLLPWWFIYSLRMEWFSGIAANIVVVGMTLGNILCPIFTKKYQKKNILISARSVMILTVIGIAVAIHFENIYLFIIMMLLRNTILPVVDGVNAGLNADVLNYHQWTYGERADAMQGVFGWFLSPVNMVIGFFLPWLLKGVGFTSDWDVLYDTAILNHVFGIHAFLNIIGLICVTVPFFFYDLTKEKHDQCVKELKERVQTAEENASASEPDAVEVQA